MQLDLAIVVPVYNEEDNVLPLTQEVAAALAGQRWTYELVFVDDASTDRTWQKIQHASREDDRVRGLRHTRNCGQSAALWTGIQGTQTPILGTMDGDLQNDPADLPKLLDQLADHDLVCGVRAERHDSWLRRFASKVARRARKVVLRLDFADTGCGMRVFRRQVLACVFPFNGLHRFLPILVHVGGARTLEVVVNHRPRVAGVSKYGIWDRLGCGMIDLLAIAWYQRRRPRSVTIQQTGSHSGDVG